MTDPVSLRPATTADIPAMLRLIHHVLRVSNTPDYGVENVERVVGHFSHDGLVAMIERAYTLLAETNGNIVGTASLGPGSADPA